MAFAKTSTLLLALFSGFAALVLNAVAVGTPFWTQANFNGSVRNYYNYASNGTAFSGPIPLLIRNRGLWIFCGYVLNVNYTADVIGDEGYDSQEPLDGKYNV